MAAFAGVARPAGLSGARAATEGRDAATPRATRQRIRVLLADDHAILRAGIVSLLHSFDDIEVVGEAGDGLEAVELAHQLEPDVILMDITMPRMSGIEATRRITRELPRIRVIGLSMHTEVDMGRALAEAGAVGYLTKGSPAQELVDAIRRADGR